MDAPPGLLLLGVAAAVTLLLAAHTRRRGGGACPRDPVRLFTGAARETVIRRAGSQCEHVGAWGRRCQRGGTQVDHIWPWSKGGPTSVGNGALLCQPHNGRKSNRRPSRRYVRRLERSRTRYFPPSASPRVDPARYGRTP